MAGVPYTNLIPIQELTPGQVGSIRNAAIQACVDMASRELALPKDRLVVRDIRPNDDLQMLKADDATGTLNDWRFDATAGTGWVGVSGPSAGTGGESVPDQKYIVLYGVRDLRMTAFEASTGADISAGALAQVPVQPVISLVRISVGGAYKVIWNTRCVAAYPEAMVAFTTSPIIIPQNSSYHIEYQFDISTDITVFLQLIGVVVEPRGLTISP